MPLDMYLVFTSQIHNELNTQVMICFDMRMCLMPTNSNTIVIRTNIIYRYYDILANQLTSIIYFQFSSSQLMNQNIIYYIYILFNIINLTIYMRVGVLESKQTISFLFPNGKFSHSKLMQQIRIILNSCYIRRAFLFTIFNFFC